MLHITQYLSTILLGSLAGTLFGLGWATSKFNDKQLVQALQWMLPPLEKWFPPLCFANLIALIALAVLERSNASKLTLVVIAVLTVVALMFITVKGNVPINQQLKRWDVQKLPAGWEAKIKQWKAYNAARTVVICFGFLSFLLAVI